ncbi:hypothetical protein ABH940_005437 [Streptacidiphilus sp. BW17]|uniref:hypothetical protein n=1 Tax=Streptacidiphilus sp. BW17 TaxID=3156274 RepID=UPI0035188924
MRIHRSAHAHGFTVLPNTLLQDRRLSYTARGILADLLSRPDGWQEDGKRMADSSPQGRMAVGRALRELTDAGYYRVFRVQQADGTWISEAHVWDTPQVEPSLPRPVSGESTVGESGTNPVKDLVKESPLPPQPEDEAPAATAAREDDRGVEGWAGGESIPDFKLQEAADVLVRVTRREPRLRLGQREAAEVAPLVAQWLERGAGEADLAQALLPGLPPRVHAALALVRTRLERKMPPIPAARSQEAAGARVRPECDDCGRPVLEQGLCRPCADVAPRGAAPSDPRAELAARGAALVRASLRGLVQPALA